MENYLKAAKERLQKESKEGQFDRHASAMKKAVMDALTTFAEQDEEFAQAIVQGGSFTDCMKAVAKGVGASISDLEAYQKAVEFYFPGAKVSFKMQIDLIGDAAGTAAEQNQPVKKGIILDLEDFL